MYVMFGVKVMSDISIDAIVDRKIIDQLDERLPYLVDERLKHIKQPSPWMTETELAEYWRLYKDGELTVASIRKWTVREEDPLPCANVGSMRRYHRDEVDRWARTEAERQKKKNEKLRKERNGPRAVGS
jgi:hypothetical protein